MILFNWVLNIPFSLKVFGVGVSIKNKGSTPVPHTFRPLHPQSRPEQADSISQATLDKILNVCSLALSTTPVRDQSCRPNRNPILTPKCVNTPKIRRSASTGRLPNNSSFEIECLALENTVRHRNISRLDGSGDAL